MIITIDGLDGSGKSTLARKLSHQLDFGYIDKPLYQLFDVSGNDNPLYGPILKMQDSVYNKTDSDALKSWFTGMSLLYIKEVMGSQNLIIDRGLLSCYAFNGCEDSAPVFECLINMGVWFDLSIFLYASPEVRTKRLAKRNPGDADLLNNKVMSLTHSAVESFLSTHNNLAIIYINTDNMNEDEVFEFALDSLKCKGYID